MEDSYVIRIVDVAGGTVYETTGIGHSAGEALQNAARHGSINIGVSERMEAHVACSNGLVVVIPFYRHF